MLRHRYDEQHTMCLVMRTDESGRSMVEMLGVLAIIGVLSAMGLMGYTLAMNKYYASTLMNEAHKRAVTVSGQIGFGMESISISSFDNSSQSYGMFSGVTRDKRKKTFTLSVTNVSKGVCEQVKLLLGENNAIGDGLPENCSGDNNEISLTFNEDLSKRDSTSSAGNNGFTSDEEGANCSGQKPGSCSVCRKTYQDETTGAWIDSDALCTDEGKICVDGFCVSGPNTEPSFSGGDMCRCEGTHYCGDDGIHGCSSDLDCKKFGSWDVDDQKCVAYFCTKNSDCPSDEYCHFNSVDTDTNKPNKKGVCASNIDTKWEFSTGTSAGEQGYVRSSVTMDWYSAQNFCRSHGKNLASLRTLNISEGCISNPLDCNIDSEILADLIANFGTNVYWMQDKTSNGISYVIDFNDGPQAYSRDESHNALCR